MQDLHIYLMLTKTVERSRSDGCVCTFLCVCVWTGVVYQRTSNGENPLAVDVVPLGNENMDLKL